MFLTIFVINFIIDASQGAKYVFAIAYLKIQFLFSLIYLLFI